MSDISVLFRDFLDATTLEARNRITVKFHAAAAVSDLEDQYDLVLEYMTALVAGASGRTRDESREMVEKAIDHESLSDAVSVRFSTALDMIEEVIARGRNPDTTPRQQALYLLRVLNPAPRNALNN